MKSQKRKSTIWRFTFLLSLFFISGCGRPQVRLGFPLGDGNSWTYQGMTTYRVANQMQSIPPLKFEVECRQLIKKPNSPFELIMRQEGEPFWRIQFVSTPQGIINPQTGELWIPGEIKIGKKWKVTMDDEQLQFILRNQGSTTVPAGTFPAYLVNFKRSKQEKGSFWLDPDVGIISLSWTSKTPGGESNTHLELASYSLP